MTTQLTTPTRRSQRGQPIPRQIDTTALDGQVFSWVGEPKAVRETNPLDIRFDDLDKIDQDVEMETHFYNAFTRSRVGKPKKKGKEVDTAPTFHVGDTVLVSTTAKTPSVGVIIAMWRICTMDGTSLVERVKIHWFLRPTELASHRARRDHLKTEIYFSINENTILTPAEIIRHCSVTSIRPKDDGSSSKWVYTSSLKRARPPAPNVDEPLFCGLAVDGRRGLFYEFTWESHQAEAMSAENDEVGTSWAVPVEDMETVKQCDESEDASDETGEEADDDDSQSHEDEDNPDADEVDELLEDPPTSEEEEEDDGDFPIPRTPSKRRKATQQTSTPRPPKRRKVKTAIPTPHSKAALKARARKVKSKSTPLRPLPPALSYDDSNERIQSLPKDPWLRAMQVLHVGARPDALPCREEEFVKILGSVESLIEEGSGGCVYISGVPGTGKTATVHGIIRELKRMAERNESNPFTYVEINGLKIPEPSAAYNLLWEGVSGHDAANDGHLKISSKEALKKLTKHFGQGVRAGPGGHSCVVLMDELDQLVTAKQDVIYNFFNWPTLVGSKLVVIAVANTMDLPERVMSGRVRSRLGMVRINFQPYTTQQLEKIVHARLQSAKEALHEDLPDVIMRDGIKFAAMKVSSISGDARRVLDICRRAVELVQPMSRPARTEDVKKVITIMQNSPTAAYLRDCSLHERIMLAALLKCQRRSGVEEVKWGDIQYQHLIYVNVLTGSTDSGRKPSTAELAVVLDSLLASHAMLIEDGAMASKKADSERRVILNIEQNEVERVLGELGGTKWKNALGS
ncbi:P-loop containing nucleoside triphosphate hydrolase protein [Rickenella mellea]|uniref:Origin recognition complex subunit 1 n=1 Tax=Rickenella mellea TaxID=50990 RepID=A0A4Y7QFU3_9AGAM|nr:P-loop containing nucleoside triphosphate hydrolase protein [Rickenella mellea]